jgi:hypothetical protein
MSSGCCSKTMMEKGSKAPRKFKSIKRVNSIKSLKSTASGGSNVSEWNG